MTVFRHLLIFLLLAGLLSMAGCKVKLPFDERQEVAELKVQTSQLEQKLTAGKQERARLQNDFEALKVSFNQARAQILKQSEDIRRLKDKQEILFKQLLKTAQRVKNSSDIQTNAEQKKPVLSPKAKVASEKLYNEALSSYRGDDFVNAVKLFAAYLRDFPETKMAANARYWLGESYYSLAQYAQAITEFNRVCKDFPESGKVPGAMLKIAMAYEAIGSRGPAQDAYEKLIRKFPGTASAQRAEKALSRFH
jgi:tol-pal system protein YbgF